MGVPYLSKKSVPKQHPVRHTDGIFFINLDSYQNTLQCCQNTSGYQQYPYPRSAFICQLYLHSKPSFSYRIANSRSSPCASTAYGLLLFSATARSIQLAFRSPGSAFRSPRSAFRSASRKLKFSRCRAFALSYNKNLICFVQAQHMGFLLYGTAQCLRTLYHIPL